MTPLHELLNRVRWDPAFGSAAFELGYYDRVRDELIFIALERTSFERTDSDTFSIEDANGQRISIPFHRVKQVRRNGEVIWSRSH